MLFTNVSVFAGDAIRERERAAQDAARGRSVPRLTAEQQAQRQAQMQAHRRALQAQTAGGPPEHLAQNKTSSETIDISKIWAELEISTEIWPDILDLDAKEFTIRKYIEWFSMQGIVLRKSPAAYVGLIDDLSRNNPEMLINPLKDVLRVVAVMEYDFDNGQDKDKMALKVLGKDFYEENKKRLGKE